MNALPAQNPFQGSVLPDARHDPEGDVEKINAEAFEACLKAVEQARAGRQSASVLLNGVPGSGKTHLLARLRMHLEDRIRRDPEALAIFVYVRLDTTPRRLWRHLREQVVEDLRREIGERSCLERLLERCVKAFNNAGTVRRLADSLQPSKGDEEGITEFLDRTVKDRNLATILTHLFLAHYRLEARAWLRGDSLPESVLERLGVITSDPDEDEDAEGRARRVVLALCRLARPSPFIFCFDQVEALEVEGDKKTGFHAFGRMGAELHDGGNHLVLISCIQTAHYNELIDYVYGADRDRVFKTRSELKPLNLDQAQALVRRRLDAVAELAQLRKKHESPLWPLDEKDLQTLIRRDGCPARRLITHCRDLYERAGGAAAPTETTGEFLERTWTERREKQLQEGTETDADGILHTALADALRLSGTAWQRADPVAADAELSFVSDGRSLYISLCNHRNMTSLAGRLRRLRDATGQRLSASSLVLMRHPRLPLPKTAKRTKQYLDELTRAGARFLQPSEEAFAVLAVLREMLAEAKAGDLHCRGETLAPDAVRDWLSTHLSPELRELAEEFLGTTPSAASDPDLWLRQALLEFLEERLVAKLVDAAAKLGESEARLAGCARRFPEQFRLLEGVPPVLYRYVPEEVTAEEQS
ncbi:MAG: ATP-binding protein [Acidobacteria bacterium]|nr:ATP-binding protein [Acidobacteriota bacterium]